MKVLDDLMVIFGNFFEFAGATEWETGFRCGSFFAIATFLLVLFVLILLRLLLFRKHQVRQIVMEGPKGNYVVSASAITDLLNVKISEFKEVSLLKTRIYPVRGGKNQITLHLNYLPGEEAAKVPELISRLQAETLGTLSETFGIDSIDSVVICVSRAKRKK